MAALGLGTYGAHVFKPKNPTYKDAVMASDFAIAQFRFLERLLVVHGHWCYKRIAQMICYFFYKNIAFGLTLFYFEAYADFSGQSIYDDWYMLLFNVVLTSLPVISLGVFEQDVSSEVCLHAGTADFDYLERKVLEWREPKVPSAKQKCAFLRESPYSSTIPAAIIA